MLKVSVKEFTDAKVLTITIGNMIIWVKICDVQKRLGIENICDLLRKEIWGIHETENPTKEQIRKYKFNIYEMLKVSVKEFTDAKVHAITIGNR